MNTKNISASQKLASAIKAVNAGIIAAKQRYSFLQEIVADRPNFVGEWALEKNAERANEIVNKDKSYDFNLLYMDFGTLSLHWQIIKNFVTENLSDEVSIDALLPSSPSEKLVIKINFK